MQNHKNIKIQLANGFMELTFDEISPTSSSKIKIDNRDFCSAFSSYGAQVTETEGEVFDCKVGRLT